MVSGRVTAFRSGLTEAFIKECGCLTNVMDTAGASTQKATYFKVIGIKGTLTEKAFTWIRMEQSMQATGRKINNMVTAKKRGLIILTTMVSLPLAANTEQAAKSGEMDQSTSETLIMVKQKVSV